MNDQPHKQHPPSIMTFFIKIVNLIFKKAFGGIMYRPDLDQRANQALVHYQPAPLGEIPTNPNEAVETKMLPATCINLVKTDFLGFARDDHVISETVRIIRVYGVGSCGPRGFYGTTELHKIAEKKLARFLNTELALLYSFGTLTTLSVINTLVERSHIVFVEQNINDSIKQALKLRQCVVYKYKANNFDVIYKVCKRSTSKVGKYLILEGISENTGGLCNLPTLLKIAKSFKMRVILDESYSFGVLGATGRGITEYYNIDKPLEYVDVICGSLEHAFGTVGGFATGSMPAIENQNVVSLSFVYSASLPAFLVQGFLTALESLDDRPLSLRLFCREVHDYFLKYASVYTVLSHYDSPRKVIALNAKESRMEAGLTRMIEMFRDEHRIYVDRNRNGMVMNLDYKLFTSVDDTRRLFAAIKECGLSMQQYLRT